MRRGGEAAPSGPGRAVNARVNVQTNAQMNALVDALVNAPGVRRDM
ncbi:hypothetical protein WJ972_15320 [Achromobacter insuavis]